MEGSEAKPHIDAIKAALDHRRETKTRMNDLIDMMVDAIKGDVKDDLDDDNEQFEKVLAISLNISEQKLSES